MRAKPVLDSDQDQWWTCPDGDQHGSDGLDRYVGMLPIDALSELGQDFDDNGWYDACNVTQTYENNYPGGDVWLDTDCQKIVGYCREGLVIDWNGEDEKWACDCGREYGSLVAADSCCLDGNIAVHYAVEYGYLRGSHVVVELKVRTVEDVASAEAVAKLMEALEAKKTPGLEPDLPMEEKYDFDAIAKKH